MTPLSSACKGLLHVYTHTYIHLPALLLSHPFSRVNLTPTQHEVEHGEQHTARGQRHQKTSPHFFSQNFLMRQSYRQGPEELRDRRAVQLPMDETLGLVWP